jgi:hypothetical protein
LKERPEADASSRVIRGTQMEPEAVSPRQNFALVVRNVQDTAVTLILEPQGREFTMPPGAVFEIRAEGPEGDHLEIDFDRDHIVVWGWSGSVVGVYHEGVELGGPSLPVPPYQRA